MDVTKQCRDINELDNDTRLAHDIFMDECKKAGLNVLITETYRSQERQKYLYCHGRTVEQCVKAGIDRDFAQKYCKPNEKQVTWTLNSNHKNRRAFDFCENVKGKEYANDAFFKKCADIAVKIGLEAGYNWTSKQDKPHLQLPVGVIPKAISKVNKTTVYIDDNGKETKIELDTILDADFNYVKMRDLVSALGFDTIYDSKSGKITIRKK